MVHLVRDHNIERRYKYMCGCLYRDAEEDCNPNTVVMLVSLAGSPLYLGWLSVWAVSIVYVGAQFICSSALYASVEIASHLISGEATASRSISVDIVKYNVKIISCKLQIKLLAPKKAEHYCFQVSSLFFIFK